VKTFRDHEGFVRLNEERLEHVLEHPEMIGLEDRIEETLKEPLQVIQSVATQPPDFIIGSTHEPG
jgi:hypothetical protein